ncbi:toprim domain-containing protein [Apibacter muscae]|uniref:CHC2 zinc finger domain-containing protein n=1 Tax=Apibacter muscae TaxID=2509004 RepID=UPI0011AC10D5|nr:CHC2 zinc finger domain-containing protein [Apibacter muscae]TWP31534.1 toprim domain-containing protein [Apibacter muscae]
MTIQEIKQNLTIRQVLEHYQIQVKNNSCCCPFHDDKTPSMQIFPDTHTVRCYSGNCQQSNKVIDVIDFIMYKENLTKHEALLKASQLTDLSHKIQRSKEYQEIPLDRLEELFYKMKSNLRQSKTARTYTQQRALDYQKLEIGYNGRTYKGLVNCIVFPLKDPNHKIVSLYGRSIKAEAENKHFYLKNRQGLYPCYPDPETKILILTESIIDTASLLPIPLALNTYSLLSCYGVNGFTQEHRQAIKELQHLEEIIIIYDNDQAGQQASHKLAQELLKIQPKSTITQVDLPSKDINEVLQLHNPEIFTQLLEQRKELILSIEKQEAREQSEQETTNQNSPKTEHLSLDQINHLIGKSGIIGEENTRLLLFIIASSYKTQSPLHAIVQGSSGSGKTHLISKIAQLIPQEDVLKFTRITESSLYNWGEWDLVGKLMVIEDLDGLKEEALYSLRELISNQQLSSSVSIKDKKGNIKSTHKKVRGVFSSLSATTKADVYEDNISRSFILAVDESTQQSKKIIEYQNQKYAGEVSQTQEKQAKEKLQNYLRNLQQVEVINPYATKLELPEEVHKIRRLNQMYQSIIRQITYLNQKNRTYKDGKIYTEIEDLEQATQILFESILLKIDELDGSLRQFYERLKKYLKDKNQEFYLREVRQTLNISKTQMFRYIQNLKELDYIKPIGGHERVGIKYKILYWDDYQKLRKNIKEQLQKQIEKLKMEQ